MPLAFHMYTAARDGRRPGQRSASAPANGVAPPKASMMSVTVCTPLGSNNLLDLSTAAFRARWSDDLATALLHADGVSNIPASQLRHDFARRLAALRKALGYEEAVDFAKSLGIDQNTYTRWERAETYPQIANLLRLKTVTGVTVDYLYFGDTSGLPLQLYRLLAPAARQAS